MEMCDTHVSCSPVDCECRGLHQGTENSGSDSISTVNWTLNVFNISIFKNNLRNLSALFLAFLDNYLIAMNSVCSSVW